MAFFSKLKAHLFFYDIKKKLQNWTSNDLNYTFFLNDYFDGKKKKMKKKNIYATTQDRTQILGHDMQNYNN